MAMEQHTSDPTTNIENGLAIITDCEVLHTSPKKPFDAIVGGVGSYIRLDEKNLSVASPPTPLLNHSYYKNYSAENTNFKFNQYENEFIHINLAPNASIFSSIINLCNSTIGAGILGLPYATKQVGWLSSIILLFLCFLICLFTFQLQTSSAILYNNKTNTLSSSYYNLSGITPFKYKLQLISDITIIVSSFGATCAYLIIIGDLMPDVLIYILNAISNDLNSNSIAILINRQFWIIIFMIFLIIPITFLRQLNNLRYTSFLAIICFLYIVSIMFILYNDNSINLCIDTSNSNCGIDVYSFDILSIFRAIPIYIFAYGSHPIAFSITNELINSNFSRMNSVIIFSFLFPTFLYLAIGLCGYFTFGNNIESNMLINYPQDNILILFARIGLSFGVTFSYPVIATPGRHSLSSIIYKRNASEISNKRFYIITSFWILMSFIVSMIVDDLGIILGFIGSTSGPMSVFILPSLYYYYSDYNNNNNHWTKCCLKVNKYGSILSFAIGVVLIPFCLVVLFI